MLSLGQSKGHALVPKVRLHEPTTGTKMVISSSHWGNFEHMLRSFRLLLQPRSKSVQRTCRSVLLLLSLSGLFRFLTLFALQHSVSKHKVKQRPSTNSQGKVDPSNIHCKFNVTH